jgi:DNA-binding LytR/AlgR family response regulator
VLRALQSPPPAAAPLRWIRASQGELTHQVAVDDVLFFRADDKYTVVRTAQGEHLIRTPIVELVAQLDPGQFWQIHRSTIVNANAIAAVTRDFRGQAHVKVRGRDESLVVSRIYSHLFKQM